MLYTLHHLIKVSLIVVKLKREYGEEDRLEMMWRLAGMTAARVVLMCVGQLWPDEREQLTVFYTGIYL
jgi:hypothetical protein